MAGFQITLQAKKWLTPDLRRALKNTHDRSTRVFTHAARIFVETLAGEVSRHQDTGMSYASLFTIARAVKANLPAPSPKVAKRKPLTYMNGNVAVDSYKTVTVGERLGQKAGRIQFGTPSRPRFNFVFEIVVFQYFLNEFGLGFRGGAAWDSIGKATDAMNAYLNANKWKMLPGASDLFRETSGGSQ